MPYEKWIKESISTPFEDEYNYGKELGRGATSIVYLCELKNSGRQSAVKVIQKQRNKKHVRSEIGVIQKMNHENIIRLIEVYETPQDIKMVTELVTGGELFDRIVTRGCYTEKDAAKCVKQILEAVKYMHEHDIVHRDLKPENLLYVDCSDELVKVGDFGLAKILSWESQMMTVCGTPGYCAPEVLFCRYSSEASSYTKAVDLWSVGVITYILLCGYEPFYHESEAEMYKKICRADYCFHSPYWDAVSLNARNLVKGLLKLDPAKRLTAAEALRHPWVTGNAAKAEHMEDTQIKLKEFNARRRLKAATHAVMVMQKFIQGVQAPANGQPEAQAEGQVDGAAEGQPAEDGGEAANAADAENPPNADAEPAASAAGGEEAAPAPAEEPAAED